MLFSYLFKNLLFSTRAGALVKKISILSVVAVSLSVTAFLLILFVMNAMNNVISDRILSIEPHLVIHDPAVTNAMQLKNESLYQELIKVNGIQAHSYESQDVILRTIDGQFRGAQARGVTVDRLKYLYRQIKALSKNSDSVSIWDFNEVPEENEIVMGIDLARALGVLEGDTLAVIAPEGLILPPGEAPPFAKVKVKKLISTNLADVDAKIFFYLQGKALGTLMQNSHREVGYEAWLPEGLSVDELKANLMQKFPQVKIETWKDRNSALLFALFLEKIVIGIFLGIAALVAGSSIISVLALLISQKKKEVALLKVMGLSKKQCVKVFTMLGFMLALMGLVPGLLMGTGLSLYLEAHPLNVLPDIYYDSQIYAKVDYFFLFSVMVITLILSFLGALLPARSTNDIEITKSFRQRGF